MKRALREFRAFIEEDPVAFVVMATGPIAIIIAALWWGGAF